MKETSAKINIYCLDSLWSKMADPRSARNGCRHTSGLHAETNGACDAYPTSLENFVSDPRR